MKHRAKFIKLFFAVLFMNNIFILAKFCMADDFALRIIVGTEEQEIKNAKTKWYPVIDAISKDVEKYSDVITRTQNGQLEILVFCTDKDIFADDIKDIRPATDINDLPVLEASLKKSSENRFYELTSKNIGKHLAEIFNQKVVFAPKIMAGLRSRFVISNVSFKQWNQVIGSSDALQITPTNYEKLQLGIWHLLGIILLIAICALGLVPAKNLPQKKVTRKWIVFCSITIAIIGSYLLGVSYDDTPRMNEQHDTIITASYEISVLYLIIGAAAGAVIGIVLSYPAWIFLRKVSCNFKRLVHRQANET